MIKNSLIIKKLNLEIDNVELFHSLSLSLQTKSINFIINNSKLTNLFFKSVLNLTDSKIVAMLFNNKIEDSFEEIGYYHQDVDIYKDLTIKHFFELSQSYYKNDYTKELLNLISLFKIDIHKKIKNLDRQTYEVIKLIDCLYHNPSLIILYEPYIYLSYEFIEILNDYLLKLNNDGSTILIYTKKIYNLHSKTNKYFMFSNNKLIDITKLKVTNTYKISYEGKLITKLKLLSLISNETSELTYTGPLLLILNDIIESKVELVDIMEVEHENTL